MKKLYCSIRNFFQKLARWVSDFVGSVIAFALAVSLIAGWILYAIPQGFSNDSQMPINSVTTIVTFLMVFLIQNAQNRESKALHLKIDELIRVTGDARNEIAKAEHMTDDDVEVLAKEFQEL